MIPYIQIGPMAVSTYFLVISLAATLAGVWFIRRMEARDLSRVQAIDLTLVIFVSAFAGARLMHVLYEEFGFYWQNPTQILQIWNGGFVYYGGLIGGLLGIYIYCLSKRIPFLVTLDQGAIPMAFSYVLGRFGCFLNGCCYGKLCELPWAINLRGEHRHPTQLYSSLGEAAIVALLLRVEKRLQKQPGQLAGLWFILHALNRMVMEHFRDDPRGDMILRLSVSTWMSVALICIGVGLLWPHPHRQQAPELQD